MMYISIVVLILFSAFFSASETAISTFNRIRVKKQAQDGNAGAGRTLRLAEQYDKTLSTILIGNNIVNITASSIATLIATALLGARGAVASTVVMTLLVLLFGEILPKNYAKQHADRIALGVSGPLRFFDWLLTPLSFAFTRLSRSLTQGAAPADTPSVTEEELMYIIDSIEEEGVIEEEERDLVQSALEFDEITVREIVTPRVNMVALDVEDSREEIIETILNEGYSRIPVYENSVDNIIGILYSRDYLARVIRGEEPIGLRELLSEPYFVHKGMKLSQLLSQLKNRQRGIAVVLDEYGGTLGIVTVEDIVEELVGDIWDEDDEIPSGLTQLGEGRYEADGSYDVQELFEELGYEDGEPDTEHATVSGWASHMLEHIPQAGESFDYLDLHITVLEMEGNRITRLGLEKAACPAGPENGAAN